MAHRPGGPKHGGRQKGTPNKNHGKTREALWQMCTEQHELPPVQFMLTVMWDKAQDMLLRVQCAKEVAPYMYAKLKQVEVQVDGEMRQTIQVVLSGSPDPTD